MFTCRTVDGVSYLKPDMSIVCWSEEHIEVLLRYTAPILLIWVIGFPLLIFVILCKKRRDLDDKITIMKFGLYYIGFKDHSFYW